MEVLVVDDHVEVAQSLADTLHAFGHRTRACGSAAEALRALQEQVPDLVLSDVRMPGTDGPALMRLIHERHPGLPVALMTAFAEQTTALDLLRHGALDYLHKPIDLKEVLALLERVGEGQGPDLPSVGSELSDGLVVHSTAMAAVVRRCDRVHALPEVAVLIEGETGTGKELIARRIHHGGDAKNAGPFIALNCAAISAELFESELFGYAPGAFTGARAQGAPGKIALAAGGTLFLDEVADLPPDQQAKLLRVLESHRYFPVGSNKEESLHARVICAANVDLLQRVQDGRFREDLYYRLKVMRIELPALRETPGAVDLLLEVFLRRLRSRISSAPGGITAEAREVLRHRSWRGNIRQLWHSLEALCIECESDVIQVAHVERHLSTTTRVRRGVAVVGASAPSAVGPEIQDSRGRARLAGHWSEPRAEDLPEGGLDLDSWQAALVRAALEKHGGSPVQAARYLGVSRKVLYTLRKRYGLMSDDETEPA